MCIKILPNQIKKQIEFIKINHFIPTIKVLTGRILEIGFGKGELFKYFNEKSCVFAIDKKFDTKQIEENKKEIKCTLNIQKIFNNRLDYENETFDAVVCSFVLCSVDSSEYTINEITRILKKEGKLILLEHIRSNYFIIKIIQKILTFILYVFSKDCHLDRDPRDFIKNDKFNIISEKVFSNLLEPILYVEAIKQ